MYRWILALSVALGVVVCLAPPALYGQSGSAEAGKTAPAAPALSIGDPAPPIEVTSWIKGEKISGFAAGNVYVLDFWATWCGPCIRAIPHMSEIQAKYSGKGVRVLGVSIWEAKPSGVKGFVDGKGDEMAYAVARDSVPPFPEGVEEGSREAQRWSVEQGAMAKSWMKAARRNGIPTVFIVNQEGRIAWIGHPMGGMDKALEEIVSGSYDLAAAARAYQKEMAAKELTDKLFTLMRNKSYDDAFALFRAKFDEAWADNAQVLNSVAWTIVDPEGSVGNKDLDLALKAAQRANELTDTADAAILDTLARVYFLRKEVAKAIALQEKAVRLSSKNLRESLEKTLEEYRKAAASRQF